MRQSASLIGASRLFNPARASCLAVFRCRMDTWLPCRDCGGGCIAPPAQRASWPWRPFSRVWGHRRPTCHRPAVVPRHCRFEPRRGTGLPAVSGSEMLKMLDSLLQRQDADRARRGETVSEGRHRDAPRRQLRLPGGTRLSVAGFGLSGDARWGKPNHRWLVDRDGELFLIYELPHQGYRSRRRKPRGRGRLQVAVARALLNLMTVGLEARPPYVYSAERVHAHVFLCTLARHLEWHPAASGGPFCSKTTTRIRPPPTRLARARSGEPAGGLDHAAPHTVHLPGNSEHCFLRRHPTDPAAAPAFELLDVDPAMMLPVRDQIE